MTEPTNADIMESLGYIKAKLSNVEVQTNKTNGRVNLIEKWINDFKIRQDERKKIEQERKPVIKNAENVTVNTQWYNTDGGQKLLLAVASIGTAVAVIITLNGGA